MDILPSSILATLNTSEEDISEADNLEDIEIEDIETEESTEVAEQSQGPWVLIVTMGGYGKRVPVSQFKLYNRATKGKIATKFKARKFQDKLGSATDCQ
jgi:DNA gyrase subunit A